jgi:5,10-methylenetetrahydromethanopterin reductase
VIPTLAAHIPSSIGAGKVVGLARSAEEADIARLWLSEDLFYHGAMPTAGAVAAVTNSIGLGFGVLTPYNRHPSLIAMEIASLLDIAGPRVTIGLGAGVKERVVRMGVPYHKPLAAVRETTRIIRQLLAGESVTLEGDVHSGRELSLNVDCPWPVPPVYLASTGPRSILQTGQIGDGLVLTIMSSVHHARWAVEQATNAAIQADRPTPIPTVVYLPLSVDDDPKAARDRLKPTIAFFLTRWAEIPPLAAMFTEWGPYASDHLANDVARLRAGETPRDVIPDSVVDEYCIAGTPTECLTRLESYRAVGVTEAALDGGHGGADLDALIGDIHRILSVK